MNSGATASVTVGARGAGGASRYMPQLDGLRGAAVLMVLAHHYLPLMAMGSRAGHATMGLFFVLSGYLITGILLRLRTGMEAGELTLGGACRVFFVRRALRIFPAYYGVLLLGLVGNTGRMQRDIFWHAGYMSNVMIVQKGEVYGTSHFWSLAVEEQFYLVWPWLVLLLPLRALPATLVVLAAAAPAYRALVSPLAAYIMTPAQLDYLAAGGLLALFDARAGGPGQRGTWGRRVEWGALGAGVLLLAVGTWCVWMGDEAARSAGRHLMRASYALLALWLVAGGSRGFGGLLGWVLTFRPLVGLGVISYGVYLIHLFVMIWVSKLAGWLGVGRPWPDWVVFAVFSTVSIAWGWASWRWFESPILRLKDRWAPAGRRGPGAEGQPGP